MSWRIYKYFLFWQSKNIIKNRKQEKILLTSTEAISSQNTYFKTDKRLRRGIMGTIRNINIRITMRIKQINPFLNTKGRVGGGGWWVEKGPRTPQLCQGLHSLLADGAGERIQWLVLDLPLDRGQQRDQWRGQTAADYQSQGLSLPQEAGCSSPSAWTDHPHCHTLLGAPAHCSNLSWTSWALSSRPSKTLHALTGCAPHMGLSKNCFHSLVMKKCISTTDWSKAKTPRKALERGLSWIPLKIF